MRSTHPLASEDAWSDPVFFTPFVGPRYDDGLVPGVRVLVLGESHYATADKAKEWGRGCTQINFEDYTSDSCDIDNTTQFFRKLPRIVTRNPNTTQRESAEGWRRIAYANFVQEFVSETARVAPTKEQWTKGQAALTAMAARLRPDVVLVLGARLWNHISEGRKCDEPWIKADRHEREVWLIPTGINAYARASWIYHPSTNYETLPSAIGVLDELLRRATQGVAVPAPNLSGKSAADDQSEVSQ